MTDIRAIAADMVAMTRAGDFHIGEKYWADDVVSIESAPGNAMSRLEGKEAVMGKSALWYANHEVQSTETFGPYVNGDQIAIRWTMDITNKQSGERMAMDEVALYTMKDGRIVEERFFY